MMINKVLVAIVFSLFTGIAVAQQNGEDEIPANVTEAFSSLYPTVKVVTWSSKESGYEASFKLDGRAVSLILDESGYVSQVKNEIPKFELPVDVGELLNKEYSGWTLGKTSHIDSFGSAYYETVVEREKQTVVLIFNRNGGLMMKMIL
jgi:hypothetical protein